MYFQILTLDKGLIIEELQYNEDNSVQASLTLESDDSTRHLLIAAAAAEDLATDSAVVASQECSELAATVVAFLAAAVGHPELPVIAVFVQLQSLG